MNQDEIKLVEGAEWMEQEVVRYAELAEYVETNARDDEDHVRGLRRLLVRVKEEGTRRCVPDTIELGVRLAFFRQMGVYDPYEEVPTATALCTLVREQDVRLWEVWSGDVCAGHVLWMHLKELLEERLVRLEECLSLLGRKVEAEPEGVPQRGLPHYELLTDDMRLETICRGLVAGGYLHPRVREAEFRYVCTGRGEVPEGPLVWTGKKNEFKLLVTTLFGGQPRIWERATGCFVHVSGPFGAHIRNTHLPLGDDSERLRRVLLVKG